MGIPVLRRQLRVPSTGISKRLGACSKQTPVSSGIRLRRISRAEAAADASEYGVVIYTVTFLDTADQTVMKQVATSTGGRHYHASNATLLRNAFQKFPDHCQLLSSNRASSPSSLRTGDATRRRHEIAAAHP